MRTSPYYARRCTLKGSHDFVAPAGLIELATLFKYKDDGVTEIQSSVTNILEGEAAWDAPIHSGKTPFPDSAEEFYDSLRPVYKDYTIIPEFKISDHVNFYSENGIKEQNPNIFSIFK